MNKPLLIVPLLTVLTTSLSFGANAPASQPDPQANAATYYQKAFDAFPANDTTYKVLDRWDTIPLNTDSDAVLANSQIALSHMHQGAQLAVCDWDLDLSKGPSLMLPFLNHERAVMQLACLRARFEIQQGQFTAAVDDVCDGMTMGRHCGKNGILVCLLVQSGIENLGIDFLGQHLKELDKNSIDELTKRLRNLPHSATLIDTVGVERQISVDWVINRLQKSAPDSDPAAAFLPDFADPNGSRALADAIKSAGGTRDAVIHQLQGLNPYYDGIAKLLRQTPTQDDFQAKASDLRDQVKDNPFAGIMFVQYTRPFDTLARSQTEMALLQEAIAIVQGGPDKAKDLQDPVNHQPIAYAETANGFELDSTVTVAGKPVTLKIGQ